MNSHAQRGEAGFSFVELLITIIIAGIAFAALVPVFVGAQQTGSRDQARTAALNVAQDGMERIRQLPWSVVDATSLLGKSSELGLPWVPTPSGSPTHWVVNDGGRAFSVTPSVVTSGTQKTVSLTVTWTQAGGGTRSFVLKTNIFRQLPGPQITDLTFVPAPDSAPPSNGNWIKTLPALGTGITTRATVNPAQTGTVAYVKFTVVDLSGRNAPLQYNKNAPDTVGGNKYSFSTWGLTTDPTKALKDGLYRITAMAYANDSAGLPGTPWVRDVRIETETPPALTNVQVYPGKITPAVVNMTWDPSTSADWAHYEVFRKLPTDTGWTEITGDSGALGLGFHDTTVTAGQTYQYVVRAVDTAGNAQPLPGGAVVSPLTIYTVTPLGSGAAAAPPAPQNMRLSFVGSAVVVAWEPPNSTADVVGYHVYRVKTSQHTTDSNATLIAVTAAPAQTIRVFDRIGTPYPDYIAFGTSYCYTVKSFNADGVESNPSTLATGQTPDKGGSGSWGIIVTPASAIYTLNIYVQNLKSTATVNILNAQNGQPAMTPGPTVTKTNPNATVTLPYGSYIVSIGTKSASVTLTGDGAIPVYVSLAL